MERSFEQIARNGTTIGEIMTTKNPTRPTIAQDGYRVQPGSLKNGYQPATSEAGPPPSGGSGEQAPTPKK